MLTRERAIIAPGEGEDIFGGGLGFVEKLRGEENGGAFAIGEHPIQAGVLAAPPHTHENEDEISFVAEGRIGVLLGGEVREVATGGYVLKPRGVAHTFWNPGPAPARVVEIFSPAGFERYFEELAGILSAGGPPDVAAIGELGARYGLTFHWDRVEEISARHGVALG